MAKEGTVDDAPTLEDVVEAVGDALNAVGYTVDAMPGLGVVNVDDPADASAMYDRVDDAVPPGVVIDVKMLTATRFQIDPDAKGRLPRREN